MGLLVFYLTGYAVAAVWTAVKLWREDLEETRLVRCVFAVILGAFSWALVLLYVIVMFGEREGGER